MKIQKLVVGKGKTTRPSDFYRDAAREKIQREAPQLYTKLFQEAKKQ